MEGIEAIVRIGGGLFVFKLVKRGFMILDDSLRTVEEDLSAMMMETLDRKVLMANSVVLFSRQ